MIVLMNWWWPYSKAATLSALKLGYKVHIIVSDSEMESYREQADWLKSLPVGRVRVSNDYVARDSKAAHTLTRFDYLPEILENANEPVLVTDADVIFQYDLNIPPVWDIGLWWPDEPRPLEEVRSYARDNCFPEWWSELCNVVYAEAMYFNCNMVALEFAQRIKRYADSLRKDGYGDRWGVDQVAITCALRRVKPTQHDIYKLNAAGRADVSTHPDPEPAIWFPHPHERADPGSPWNRRRHVQSI